MSFSYASWHPAFFRWQFSAIPRPSQLFRLFTYSRPVPKSRALDFAKKAARPEIPATEDDEEWDDSEGYYEKALDVFQQAARLKPDDATYHYYVGITYLAMDKKQEALKVYRTVQRLDRKTAQALLAEINKSK